MPVGDCLLVVSGAVVSGERSLGVLSRGQRDSWLPEMAALHLLTGLVTDMRLVHASSPRVSCLSGAILSGPTGCVINVIAYGK